MSPSASGPEITTFTTLISVHLPKTAGLSLRAAFLDAFGAKRVVFDYADDPADPRTALRRRIGAQPAIRPLRFRNVRVVHGHFAIGKYDALTAAARAVMLREPVDNLISIYFFWKHLAASGHWHGHALYERFLRERPDVLDFARYPALRTLLSHTYFGDVDMRRFDIIGDFSDRTEYYLALSRAVGVRLDMSLEDNRSPASDARDAIRGDARMTRALRDILADDLRFYERWAQRPVPRVSNAQETPVR